MINGLQSNFPKLLGPNALAGLAGDFVRLVEQETEADPAALLFQFLAGYGSLIGKGPHFTVGATKHFANLFVSLVGDTAVARKGTSWDLVKRVLDPIDETWTKQCRISGLGSGEALIASVRDATAEEMKLPTVKLRDKRALVDEGELAKIIKVSQREGSTLSSVLRNAWDGGDLQNRVKDQANCLFATKPHVTIVAHCTREELLRLVSSTDISNGSVNRYLWVCSRRTKLVALPKLPDDDVLKALIDQIRAVVEFAKKQGAIHFTPEAETLWLEIYPSLNQEKLGIQGALAARAAPMVIRLALIYALLDHESAIGPTHLQSALEAWRYAEGSVEYIFGNGTGDKSADKLIAALDQAPKGLTRTEISAVFGRNAKSEWLDKTLGYLRTAGYIDCQQESPITGTKPVERWLLKQDSNSSNSCFVQRNQSGGTQ